MKDQPAAVTTGSSAVAWQASARAAASGPVLGGRPALGLSLGSEHMVGNSRVG